MFSTQTQIIFTPASRTILTHVSAQLESHVSSAVNERKVQIQRGLQVWVFSTSTLQQYSHLGNSWATSDTSVEPSNVIYKTTPATYSKDIPLWSSYNFIFFAGEVISETRRRYARLHYSLTYVKCLEFSFLMLLSEQL